MDLTTTGRYARLGATAMGERRLPRTEESIDVIVRSEEDDSLSSFDIHKNADVVFDLGEDKYLRAHKIHVRIGRGADGALGLEVRSSLGGLTVRAEAGNHVYLSTMRGDLMPPPQAEQPDDFDVRDDATPCGSDD